MTIEANKGEKHMADTIELLEAIGQDASLRYASTEELTKVLKQVKASDALSAAVAFGDSSQLSQEFGPKPMQAPQIVQAPAREDDEPEEDDIGEPLDSPASDRSNSSSCR